MLLNNIVETFNAYIKELINKPIITMMEIIRRQLMKRFHVKRNGMMQYSQIVCPRILQKLKFSKTNSRICLTNFGGYRTFEVKHCDGNQNVVNLFKRTCKCKKWQLIGIPCDHGVVAIYKDKGRLKNYLDGYYSNETFLKCYAYHKSNARGGNVAQPYVCVDLASKSENLDREA